MKFDTSTWDRMPPSDREKFVRGALLGSSLVSGDNDGILRRPSRKADVRCETLAATSERIKARWLMAEECLKRRSAIRPIKFGARR